MRFLPGNAQHIGARHSQQDSFGFADPSDEAFIAHGGFLAVVCDGMGGMEHGDAASRTAVRVFLDAYARKTPWEPVPAALDRSAREANAQVVALSHSLGRSESIGTTLIGATLLSGGPGQARLYWVSVGDSGLFLIGGGQMRMVNHPHVFANHLDAAAARGTISAEAAMAHPERESLTSFIGAEQLEEIDLTAEPMILADGDAILLASDGMFKTLAPAEIAASLQGHPQGWPEILVDQTLARHREAQDNVTVLSVSVEPVGTVVPASASHALPAEFVEHPQAARTVSLPAHAPEPPVFGTLGSLPAAAPAATPPSSAPPAQWPPAQAAPSFQAPSQALQMQPPQPGAPQQQMPTFQSMPAFQPPPGPGYQQLPGPVFQTGAGPAFQPAPGSAFQPAPGVAFQPAAGPAVQAPSSRGRAWIWILLLVLCLGAGAGGSWYWFVYRAKEGPSVVRSAEPGGTVKAPPADPDLPIKPLDPGTPVEPSSSGQPGKEPAPR